MPVPGTTLTSLRPLIQGTHGVVVASHPEAAQIGLEILRQGKGRTLADYSLEQLTQAGDSEFLNWMVALGTVGDVKAASTAYMPDYVATGWGFVSWKL